MAYRMGKGDIEMRQGFLKFHRAGNLTFIDQSHFPHAPAKKGLWAFPYPFFDKFFVYHKYDDFMPKRLKTRNLSAIQMSEIAEEREEWIKKHGKNFLKPKIFWYSGYLYSRMIGTGCPENIDEDGDDEYSGTAWNLMHTSDLYKHIKSGGGDRGWEFIDGEKRLIRYSIDHLEVFIPPHRGTLREGTNPPKK